MKNRLPVYLDDRELPKDEYRKRDNSNSYGYVNVLYLSSIIITIASVITVIVLGNR